MKIVVSCLAAVAFSCALIAPVTAQQRAPKDTYDPPRGVEGPELRKQAPKGTGETGAPKAKRDTRARGQKPKDTYDPPRGVEGPELRKQAPKGTGETGAPKAGKKSPRAGGQKPNPADSRLPKTSPGPEVTRDDGKKDSVTR